MNINISANGDHLVIHDLNNPFPLNSPLIYENIGLDKFRSISDVGLNYSQGESEIVFIRNSSNEIISLKTNTFTLYPISTN
tara:strand:- start:411 stop:653 length:243 start_codon:yes stop_codon:yes gene_type:complete